MQITLELTHTQIRNIQYALFTLDEWTQIATSVTNSTKLDKEEKFTLLAKIPTAAISIAYMQQKENQS